VVMITQAALLFNATSPVKIPTSPNLARKSRYFWFESVLIGERNSDLVM